MTIDEVTKTPKASAKPTVANVNVCVYKYTSYAGDDWSSYEGSEDIGLYQIQVEHFQQRSITYSFRNSFDEYLKATLKKEGAQVNLAELENAGIRLVFGAYEEP